MKAEDGAISVSTEIEVRAEETTDLRSDAEQGATLLVSYEGTEDQVDALVLLEGVLVARDDWIERHTVSRFIVPSGNLVLRARLHGAKTVEERRLRVLPGQAIRLLLDL